MRTTRKARQVIDSLVGDNILSETGLEWLTLATDPFHDTDIRCSGYPDLSVNRSVLQTFTKTTTISRPPTYTGASWSLHTFFNPATDPHQIAADPLGRTNAFYQSTVDRLGQITAQPVVIGTPHILSGVNAVATDGSSALTSSTNVSHPDISWPLPESSGAYRLISCGYEIVNVSSELNKQGSITCYRSSGALSNTNLRPATGSMASWTFAATIGSALPTTQAEATQYPGSKTWQAGEGAYIVVSSNDHLGYNLQLPGKVGGIYQDHAPTSGAKLWLPYFALTSGTAGGSSNTTLPYDVCGAILTGLSNESIIQVTARYIIERMPTIDEPDLLVLSRPPAPYDPVALEIYARTMTNMPVACMVKENPLGEWFHDVLSTLGDVAPGIGEIVGNFIPGASAVGRAIGGGLKTFTNMLPSDRAQSSTVPRSPAAPSRPACQPQKRKKKTKTAGTQKKKTRA